MYETIWRESSIHRGIRVHGFFLLIQTAISFLDDEIISLPVDKIEMYGQIFDISAVFAKLHEIQDGANCQSVSVSFQSSAYRAWGKRRDREWNR